MKSEEYNFSNSELTPNAQKLRREMTKEEKNLWYDFLKTLPVTFKRQKVIGNYIADFYCYSAKLIIELDGDQHFSDDNQIKKDIQRTKFFNSLGLTVLRYSNYDIQTNFRGICDEIFCMLNI